MDSLIRKLGRESRGNALPNYSFRGASVLPYAPVPPLMPDNKHVHSPQGTGQCHQLGCCPL